MPSGAESRRPRNVASFSTLSSSASAIALNLLKHIVEGSEAPYSVRRESVHLAWPHVLVCRSGQLAHPGRAVRPFELAACWTTFGGHTCRSARPLVHPARENERRNEEMV